jgi:hypothetical protein
MEVLDLTVEQFSDVTEDSTASTESLAARAEFASITSGSSTSGVMPSIGSNSSRH